MAFKKATEEKILDICLSPSNYSHDPHLVTVYAGTLSSDDFVMDETEDTCIPKEDVFLHSIKDRLDLSDEYQKVKLETISSQIVERFKCRIRGRTRSRTRSSSQKRPNCEADEQGGNQPVKQKTGIPLPSKA